MKLKLLIGLFFLFAMACQNKPKETEQKSEPVAKEQKQEVPETAQKVEIQISGMTCTGCENAIQKTIDGFDGVYTSKADHQKGIAIVELDSTKVDLNQVKDAINEMGYEAKDHNMLNQ